MTDNEINRIKPGDKIKLICDVLRTPECTQGEFYIKLSNIKFYISQEHLKKCGEHLQRKFKKHDLVRHLDEPTLVLEDENEEGIVLVAGHYAKHDQLDLLCPAEILRKMRTWEGESHD